MSSEKENTDEGEWEDVVMMMELPPGANLRVAKKDLYLQVAGMWTDKPVVKLDNMLYAGKISETMGSDFFVEYKDGDEVTQSQQKKDRDRQMLVSQTVLTLEPVYLEEKTALPL